jgi:hypothetical protein
MKRNKDGLGELTESFREPRISEDKIMLENIWHHDESQNISHLDNSQIALLYTYDFGGESPIPMFQELLLTLMYRYVECRYRSACFQNNVKGYQQPLDPKGYRWTTTRR